MRDRFCWFVIGHRKWFSPTNRCIQLFIAKCQQPYHVRPTRFETKARKHLLAKCMTSMHCHYSRWTANVKRLYLITQSAAYRRNNWRSLPNYNGREWRKSKAPFAASDSVNKFLCLYLSSVCGAHSRAPCAGTHAGKESCSENKFVDSSVLL